MFAIPPINAFRKNWNTFISILLSDFWVESSEFWGFNTRASQMNRNDVGILSGSTEKDTPYNQKENVQIFGKCLIRNSKMGSVESGWWLLSSSFLLVNVLHVFPLSIFKMKLLFLSLFRDESFPKNIRLSYSNYSPRSGKQVRWQSQDLNISFLWPRTHYTIDEIFQMVLLKRSIRI